MNLIKYLSFMTVLTTGTQAAYSAERSSHFTDLENHIYQTQSVQRLDNIFNKFFNRPVIEHKDAYPKILKECAENRAAIADFCARKGLLDEAEAGEFHQDRIGRGLTTLMHTQLKKEDNRALYSIMSNLFEKEYASNGAVEHLSQIPGMNMFPEVTYQPPLQKKRLSLMSSGECSYRSQLYQIKLNFNKKEFVNQLLAHEDIEANMFTKVFNTLDCIELLNKNPQIGSLQNMGYNDDGAPVNQLNLHPHTRLITLRQAASLDNGSTLIPIGSLSSVSVKKTNGQLNFYDYFVIIHAPCQSIQPLLDYAEKNWRQAIRWFNGYESLGEWHQGDSPQEFKDSLACFYWAQTVATPYMRGSESITKWMLTLTARFKDQELLYSDNFAFRMPFVMDIEDFVGYFKQNVFFKQDIIAVMAFMLANKQQELASELV